MPTYEYHCEGNGQVIEVSHKMAERLSTWGELCARAGIDSGKTTVDAPVRKLMSAGFVNTKGSEQVLPCGGSTLCGSGMCSMN